MFATEVLHKRIMETTLHPDPYNDELFGCELQINSLFFHRVSYIDSGVIWMGGDSI